MKSNSGILEHGFARLLGERLDLLCRAFGSDYPVGPGMMLSDEPFHSNLEGINCSCCTLHRHPTHRLLERQQMLNLRGGLCLTRRVLFSFGS